MSAGRIAIRTARRAECRKWRDHYGLKQVGIAFIWERLRYIYVIKKRTGEDFRLNNN
jgi:hypothetical protein